MKLISHNLRANSAAALAGLLLVPLGAQATPLAYEGFDYATGSSNLTSLNGGTGWNGAWQTVNNGSADVVSGSLAAGASSPTGYDAHSLGNSSTLPNNRRVGRFLNTSTGSPFGLRGYRDVNGRIGADGTTLYLSFTQKPNGTSAYYEFEFHRSDLGDGGRIGGIGNDQGGDNVNLRAPNGTHSVIGAGTTAVNFYIVRIDYKAGNDDVYVYRNSTSATNPGTGAATLTKLAVSDMSFNGVSFGAFNNSRTVSHDELRFGTTWEDVATTAANAAPVITLQPKTSTNTYVGGNFTLIAAASGQPDAPTYQWYKGVDPLGGQTNATLTLTNVQPGDAGAYHVVATNSQGSVPSNDGTLVVQATPAGLLAYEGFDYSVGNSSMDGKNGGIGWGAAWQAVDNGGSSVQSGSLTAGTNAPNGYDAMSGGNSSFMPNTQRSGRLIDTSPTGRFGTAGYVDLSGNIGADGKTLYLSFMQQPDGTSLFYEFEFHRGNLGDPGRIGGIGNDTNNPTVSLRAPNNATSLIGPGSTGVNFYVVRIDFKAGNDDVRVYQNPVSAVEPGTPTLTKTAVADMSFNGLSLAAFVNGRTVKHDEIRVGQNWSDVVFGTSRLPLTWVGNGTTNNWSGDPNWNDGIGATPFTDGNPVTFNDSGSDTPAVNVGTNVSTGSLTVTGDTKNYSIGGSGTITCSGALNKSGLGSLALTGTSNFSSAIAISGGSLSLAGTTTVGSTLNINPGTVAVNMSGTNTFTGTMFANSGTQALSGTNTFGGMQTTNSQMTITGPTFITGTGGTFVHIGNLTGANATLTVEPGGSLTISGAFSDAWVIGRDGGNAAMVQNGGTVTYLPPNNHLEAFIGAAASGGTTASYELNNGTLEMSTSRLGVGLGVTATLNQHGGIINTRQLDLGANLAGGNGIFNLTGGVINIGAGGITNSGNGGAGHYEINLSGGTVGALADWSTLLPMKVINNITFNTATGRKITLGGGVTDLDTPTAAGGLTKTGPGTLVVGGFNDYTGATVVSEGTFGGSGSQASVLSVASGAALAPGDNGTGVFYCDSATFASGSTLAIDINSTAVNSDAMGAFGGNITIASGANVSFAEVGAGFIPADTVLVIAESATAITGTFTGHPNNSTVTVGSNVFTLNYTTNQITLTSVGSPYANWAISKGLDGSPGRDPAFTADPDSDSIANGLEWVLGGDPLVLDGTSLYTATGSPTGGLTLTFNRSEDSIGNASLIVEWDDNLDGVWTQVPITQSGGSYPNGVTVVVNEAATPDAVTVNIPASNAPGGHVFARLRAILP